MKCHGLVQCYFPWTAKRYNNQVLAFTKELGPPLARVLSVDQAFRESEYLYVCKYWYQSVLITEKRFNMIVYIYKRDHSDLKRFISLLKMWLVLKRKFVLLGVAHFEKAFIYQIKNSPVGVISLSEGETKPCIIEHCLLNKNRLTFKQMTAFNG